MWEKYTKGRRAVLLEKQGSIKGYRPDKSVGYRVGTEAQAEIVIGIACKGSTESGALEKPILEICEDASKIRRPN